MFLSQLMINCRTPYGRTLLNNIYCCHQRLWQAFPDMRQVHQDPFFLTDFTPSVSKRPFLFRIERDGGQASILVQSTILPHWHYAFQNCPYLLAAQPRVGTYHPTVKKDHTYQFRLLANVIRRVNVPVDYSTPSTGATLVATKKREIQILPVVKDDGTLNWHPWLDWLTFMGKKYGFTFDDHQLRMESVYVRKPEKMIATSSNGKKRCRFTAGLFNGVLTCTDPESLMKGVQEGIGRARAFGFGLLSLKEVHQ